MIGSGVERVPSPGRACWMCGLPAVCGEKLPGRRHKVRALCLAHAGAVFGADDPPWRRWDARTQRDIVEEWLRGMTILAHGGGRPVGEMLAEIAAVDDAGTQAIRLMSPLMPGEARDLQETSAPRTSSGAARPWCTPWSLRSCSTGAPPPPARPAATSCSAWR